MIFRFLVIMRMNSLAFKSCRGWFFFLSGVVFVCNKVVSKFMFVIGLVIVSYFLVFIYVFCCGRFVSVFFFLLNEVV